MLGEMLRGSFLSSCVLAVIVQSKSLVVATIWSVFVAPGSVGCVQNGKFASFFFVLFEFFFLEMVNGSL